METKTPTAFFVYGTLKKSQLRGGLWPRRPLEILPAIIQADLFDLGPYPAAAYGDNWLMGEIWQFKPDDMRATIEALDHIEGYEALANDNEYLREIVTVEVQSEEATVTTKAYAYFAAQVAELAIARPIQPWLQFLGRNVAAWPDARSRTPKSFAEE